jgi:hypothetical protein
MVRRNVNLAKVQRALGHRSINSTMVYVGVSDQEADGARHNAFNECVLSTSAETVVSLEIGSTVREFCASS